GTALISSAGGIVDVKYTDFRDAFGQQNIFTLSKQSTKQDSKPVTTPPGSKPTTTPTPPIIVKPPIDRVLAPLQQTKGGTAPEMVECREGFELIIRSTTGAPACVYPHTAEKLRSLGLATR
ncbi:MAG TPA: hypothetical protein VIG05_05225, partial [Candidatus Nitrosotenuis sp.]